MGRTAEETEVQSGGRPIKPLKASCEGVVRRGATGCCPGLRYQLPRAMKGNDDEEAHAATKALAHFSCCSAVRTAMRHNGRLEMETAP